MEVGKLSQVEENPSTFPQGLNSDLLPIWEPWARLAASLPQP